MNIETTLQEYIVSQVLVGKKHTVGIDESLISSGILDSLTLLALISFVEKRFNLEVSEREMHPDNFQTISRIKRLIESKQKGSLCERGNHP